MPTETDLAQILEKLEHKIETGQTRTEAKLDQLMNRMEVLEVGQARLEEKMNGMNQRFEAVDKRFEASDQRLDRIEDNLKRQDNRLWGFLVAFGIALLGLLAKYAFFMPKV